MNEKSESQLIYVKKWTRTPHAMLFRLSNKVVQVCFADHAELLLCSNSREVTYVNKQGTKYRYLLSTAMESSDVEMSKRLRYTKGILSNMLNPNGANHP